MAIGVEINGGGNNKVSKSSFHLTGDSKAVVINESEGNEISEIFVVVRENIEKLEQMQNEISAIDDNSINPRPLHKPATYSRHQSQTQLKTGIGVKR